MAKGNEKLRQQLDQALKQRKGDSEDHQRKADEKVEKIKRLKSKRNKDVDMLQDRAATREKEHSNELVDAAKAHSNEMEETRIVHKKAMDDEVRKCNVMVYNLLADRRKASEPRDAEHRESIDKLKKEIETARKVSVAATATVTATATATVTAMAKLREERDEVLQKV